MYKKDVIQVKKRFISLVVLIFLLSTSLVFASDDLFNEYGVRKDVRQTFSEEKVENLESKDDVEIDKEWTVEFNQEIQLDDIFSMSIKKDDIYIPVDIDISDDKEAKITPVNDYEYNTEYSVYISLFNGNQYKMDFKTIEDPKYADDTEKPNVSNIEAISPYYTLVEFNEQVDDSSINFEIYEKDTDNELNITEIWDTSENGILVETEKQENNEEYELKILGVSDLAGNTLKDKTVDFEGIDDEESNYGFSRENPYKYDWWWGLVKGEKTEISIGVIDIIRGESALGYIKEMNQFNDDPGYGKEYILAKMCFKLEESDSGSFEISPYDFEAVSGNGVTYNTPSITFDDYYFEEFDRKIYDGAEFIGWLAFEVDKDDKNPLLLWNNQVWFELYE